MSRDHRNLKAFQLADALVLEVYRVTRSFPRDEQFGLVSQLRRAAVSVPSNIVEGCGRSTEKERLRFLEIAFGSLREVIYQLELAHRLGYTSEETAQALAEQSDEAARVLAGLIRSIPVARAQD